jgi:hypothetical protein
MKDMNIARIGLLVTFAGAAALCGCGNYSNEDLEYLSAIPQTDDLSVEPPRQSAVRPALEDDALQTINGVTTSMNKTADGLLALVEQIRSGYPTSRNGNERIWGPGPADGNPGWQFEFVMTKTTATTGTAASFAYALMMIPPGGTAAGALTVLSGSFDAAGGARTGVGHIDLTPAAARDAGAVFPGLEKLMSLSIIYDTQGWPRSLEMDVVSIPGLDPTMDALNATYTYQRSQNGDGAMTFTFVKDVIMGPAGAETLSLAGHWHGTGEGRADIDVVSGDGAGLTWTDCWGTDSQTAYNSRTGAGDQNLCIPLL